MAPKILVVQPSPRCPAARLGDWLAEAGASLTVVVPEQLPGPDAVAGFDAVVCLGGPMGARDDQEYPWLAEVRSLLAAAHSGGLAVLGVCLGAQLLAVALGGSVRTMPDGPEVGTRLVAKRDAAGDDPLFAEVPHLPDVLQFHHDEIASMPPGAVLLAAGTVSDNQAFRVGSRTYGVQFHIETTPDVVLSWAASDPDAASATRDGELDGDNLAAVHEDIAATWRPFTHRFVQLAAGEGMPGATSRQLPLV